MAMSHRMDGYNDSPKRTPPPDTPDIDPPDLADLGPPGGGVPEMSEKVRKMGGAFLSRMGELLNTQQMYNILHFFRDAKLGPPRGGPPGGVSGGVGYPP